MKQEMKCPACKEISTFTATYHVDELYTAPIKVENGEAEINFDAENQINSDMDTETIQCDKCNEEVSMQDIEIIEVELATPNR